MKKGVYSVEAGPPRNSANVAIRTACAISKRYSRRLPTVQELQNDFGMHRATAYRWLAAMKDANWEMQNV